MNYATGLGFLAVFFWATLAVTAQRLQEVPLFFQLGFAFLGPGLFVLHPRFHFRVSKAAVFEIGASASALIAYHYCLFAAFRWADPGLVNSINYLWPLFLILFTPIFFPDRKLKPLHWISGGICFLGVFIQSVDFHSGSHHFSTGLALAFLAALIWPLYSLGKAKWGKLNNSPSLIWSCFFSGLFFLSLFVLESKNNSSIDFFQTLSLATLVTLVWMSLGPFGLAFYFWALALKKGDPRRIALISYLTPILSMTLLWAYLEGPIQPLQLTGFGLILLGLLLSSLC